ncbi:MAG: NADAR family protein [Saprospiraceae bacterium]|nr:NADAR family protein [Saprospiraceae bacterium]
MIDQFINEYRWMSNFYPCEIRYKGTLYKSVEYAYMSAKSSDKEWKKMCSDGTEKQRIIKKKSKDVDLVPNWDEIRIDVMRECLEWKFSQEPLASWLIETGDAYLEEGNNWGDHFWGVDLETGVGENNLGKLLMEIRTKISGK